nr:MAG TPA: hypothetical protein [Caudoviricetes sp.]
MPQPTDSISSFQATTILRGNPRRHLLRKKPSRSSNWRM